ncbi:MAG: hypothetical protein DI598_12960 [Pseudopedobacter saltans]|uniref:Uncharacterized protein n=1 Tax=Pseudopedobacter saltans TaxID=151895 RepID=A0A2W5GIY9_9SPHI|nr:MAG: hypothetical protein DI598_12960 [Pseudopedobacter saltans]
MKTPLDQLIAYYRKEKKFLEKEIRNCLKYEKDYYTANLLQNGLWKCEEALQELEVILHPFNDEIENLRYDIDRLNKAIENNIEEKYFQLEDTFYTLINQELNPEISELRQKHLEICNTEISKILKKISELENRNQYSDDKKRKI